MNPRSFLSVLQQPSLNHPVTGSFEQGSKRFTKYIFLNLFIHFENTLAIFLSISKLNEKDLLSPSDEKGMLYALNNLEKAVHPQL